jgi:DNA primase
LGETLIPDETISEIRERVDIVALIGEHIALKRKGASYVGICPFHAEKTPSFHVSQARQFYHCFGCQESGDVVSFVMKFEGRNFPEAVAALAERAGIEIREKESTQDLSSRRDKAHRDRRYALMETAAVFYQAQLKEHHTARVAQDELRKREVDADTAAKFRLGYAPDSWDALEQYLRKKGVSLSESAEVGLVGTKRDGSGYYDRFRNRLMFPVFDIQGRVVAFSGRILGSGPEVEKEAKYLNSPETALYSKGSLLFGLHQARLEIRRRGYAIICEGNFDLLALYRAGFPNAVAPLGTAFTEAQARLLRRFSERAVLMFDSDSAGRKAVVAAFYLLANAGMSGRVVTLPPGHDPDSFLREKGQQALTRLVDEAQGIVEYLIDLAASKSNQGAADVGTAIGKLAPILAQVQSPVERHKYLEHIAQRFDVRDLRAVQKELNNALRNNNAQRNQRAADVPIDKMMAPASKESVRLPPLECELVGALLDFPELFAGISHESSSELLTNAKLRSIFEWAKNAFGEKGELNTHELLKELEPELGEESVAYRWLKERLVVQKFDSALEAKTAVESGIRQLKKESIERKFRLLAGMISEARRKGDDELALVLSNQQVALTRDARSVVQGLKR